MNLAPYYGRKLSLITSLQAFLQLPRSCIAEYDKLLQLLLVPELIIFTLILPRRLSHSILRLFLNTG